MGFRSGRSGEEMTYSGLAWKRLTGECLGSPSIARLLASSSSMKGLRLAEASRLTSEVAKTSRRPESRLLLTGMTSVTDETTEVDKGAFVVLAALLASDCEEERSAGVVACNLDTGGRVASGLTGLAPGRICSARAVGEFSLRLVRRVLLEVVLFGCRLTDVFDRGSPTSAEGEVDD